MVATNLLFVIRLFVFNSARSLHRLTFCRQIANGLFVYVVYYV